MRGRLQHRRLRLLGADGREPRAGACAAAPIGCRTSATARAPSTPTRRRPAPSAASACRRRRSPHETLMDDLAEQLGLDRWQIRRIERARPWRRDALGPGAARFRRPAGMSRCAEAGLGRRARAAPPPSTPHEPGAAGAASASPACGMDAAIPRWPIPRPCGSRSAATAGSRSSTAPSISARARTTVLTQIAADALGAAAGDIRAGGRRHRAHR